MSFFILFSLLFSQAKFDELGGALRSVKDRKAWLQAVERFADTEDKKRLSSIFFTTDALSFYQELHKNWRTSSSTFFDQYQNLDPRDKNHIFFLEYFFTQHVRKFECRQAERWSGELVELYSDIYDLNFLADQLNACLKNKAYFSENQESLARESFLRMYLKIFPTHKISNQLEPQVPVPSCASDDDISFEELKRDPWLCVEF